MVFACGGSGGGGSHEMAAGSHEVGDGVPYEVLKMERPRNEKYKIDVLVDEKTSKQDVLKLAEYLRGNYVGRYTTISIFDSREAWRAADAFDQSYPEKELSRHWLVDQLH
jgi:hypothetical protein